MRSDLFVLVGSDGDELGLLEDEGAERAVRQLQDVVGHHEVEAGLVLVHRVQDRLEKKQSPRPCHYTLLIMFHW